MIAAVETGSVPTTAEAAEPPALLTLLTPQWFHLIVKIFVSLIFWYRTTHSKVTVKLTTL